MGIYGNIWLYGDIFIYMDYMYRVIYTDIFLLIMNISFCLDFFSFSFFLIWKCKSNQSMEIILTWVTFFLVGLSFLDIWIWPPSYSNRYNAMLLHRNSLRQTWAPVEGRREDDVVLKKLKKFRTLSWNFIGIPYVRMNGHISISPSST